MPCECPRGEADVWSCVRKREMGDRNKALFSTNQPITALAVESSARVCVTTASVERTSCGIELEGIEVTGNELDCERQQLGGVGARAV